MKKYLLSLSLVLALVIVPLVSQASTLSELLAQLAALQAKIAALSDQPTSATINSCWFKPTQDLSYGDGEGDGLTDHVSTLQRYLISKGYLSIAKPTGFYGQMTMGSVKSWQHANNLAVTGNIRAADRAVLCGSNIVPSLPCASGEHFNSLTGLPCQVTTCPKYSPPAPDWCSGGTIQSPVMGSDGCYGPARCVYRNNNIVINSVSGPNSLNIGQTGTWQVNATAPSGTSLTYSVDWGDNALYPYPMNPGLKSSIEQTSSFTHSYPQAGTYKVKFSVSGAPTCPPCLAGMTCPCTLPVVAQTSLTVVVGDDVIGCPQVLPNCPVGTNPQSYVGTDGCTNWRCVTSVVCPQDMYRCSSGLSVSRTGPNCQFACPTTVF